MMDVGPARVLIPLLRIFFNLLYHQFAWTYDLVSGLVSIGMWNEWIKSIIPDITGQHILELGHGPGHIQIALLLAKKNVIGIDLSPQMGRIAAKKIRNKHLQPNLVNGNAQHLPYPENSFDHVISTFPTQYIIAPNTIMEMHRVLRPGGEFLILPVAWITGRRSIYKAAAWLFKVTGQTPAIEERVYDSELKKFERFGFKTYSEVRKLENSQVMLIRGVKALE